MSQKPKLNMNSESRTNTRSRPNTQQVPPSAHSRGGIFRLLRDPQALREFRQNMPSWSDEAGAFGLILLGLLIFSAMLNPSGDFAGPIADALRIAFGLGGYFIALLVGLLGVMMLLPKAGIKITLNWTRILALELVFMTSQGLFHALSFAEEPRDLAREGAGGGYVGWAISSLSIDFLGESTAILALAVSGLFGFGVFIGIGRRDIRFVFLSISEILRAIANQLRPTPLPVDDIPIVVPTDDDTAPEKTIDKSENLPILEDTSKIETKSSVIEKTSTNNPTSENHINVSTSADTTNPLAADESPTDVA